VVNKALAFGIDLSRYNTSLERSGTPEAPAEWGVSVNFSAIVNHLASLWRINHAKH
jgi:hypothetical protein